MHRIIHPVILCGGAGKRLWPLSTHDKPKQFNTLISDKSMIVETAERVASSYEKSISFSEPLAVGSIQHEALLNGSLPRAQKILEPFGRNSAPAVAAACLVRNPDDLVLILPADHSIQNVPAFHRAIDAAADAGSHGAIVTFGVKPTYPSTGHGYIKSAGAAELNVAGPVTAFVEKPRLEDAKAYLAAGAYFWNAGIFLFKASTMLDALKAHAPDVLARTNRAIGDRTVDRIVLDSGAFRETPSVSIDSAVMEHAQNIVTVPVDMDWRDVGGYPTLHELSTKHPVENATFGPVIVQNSRGLYVRSEGPLVAVSGVSDLSIVATANEILISPLGDANAVKSLGAEAQKFAHSSGDLHDFADRARNWLWRALDVWAEKAWDPIRGGFVEQLTLDGKPDPVAARRLRVQARQVFSFAKAINLGWLGPESARAIVGKGVDFIDKRLRHPDGGWVHTFHPDGTPIDERRDLYDHAFIILAGVTAYDITGDQTALRIAKDAMAFVDVELKDDENGGWFEAKPAVLPRRANPHMHMLEAMLDFHIATGCERAIANAAEIVRLFECRFFNPAIDVMAETFSNDWRVETAQHETLFEPGHHYEWATLLFRFEQITGHDTGSWRRRLIRKANKSGTNPDTGFAYNLVRADGRVLNNNSRLWHQLERFRATWFHPADGNFDTATRLMDSLSETYLESGPAGGWVDEIDATASPVSAHVPASTLYHVICAMSSILLAE